MIDAPQRPADATIGSRHSGETMCAATWDLAGVVGGLSRWLTEGEH